MQRHKASLRVTLIELCDFRLFDGSTSKPYAILNTGAEYSTDVYRSTTKPKCSGSCRWDETFNIDLEDAKYLQIGFYHANKVFADDLMGTIQIPLAHFVDLVEHDAWYRVAGGGFVHLNVLLHDPSIRPTQPLFVETLPAPRTASSGPGRYQQGQGAPPPHHQQQQQYAQPQPPQQQYPPQPGFYPPPPPQPMSGPFFPPPPSDVVGRMAPSAPMMDPYSQYRGPYAPPPTGFPGFAPQQPSAPPSLPQSIPRCQRQGCNDPAYVDPASGRVFPFCSKRHAHGGGGGPAQKPAHLCALPGCNMPVARDAKRTYKHCSKRHARQDQQR